MMQWGNDRFLAARGLARTSGQGHEGKAPLPRLSGRCPVGKADLRRDGRKGGECVRGRDVRCRTPPAQIRTSGFPASGSYLGCLTAKLCGLPYALQRL